MVMMTVAARLIAPPLVGNCRRAALMLVSLAAPNTAMAVLPPPTRGRRFKSTRPEKSSDSSTLMNSAAEFFVSMRWKAANALTASLSAAERQVLLQRLDVNRSAPEQPPAVAVVDANDVQNSIAEAVAAARAQESRLHAEKWEREKEALVAEAERAATARVESDLAIQKRRLSFEAWKERVDAERGAHSAAGTAAAVEPAALPLAELEPHPILGPCVLDLGYKRVHVVSAQALAAIPVWKKQRIYRHDRAKAMAADKQKTMHLGMPGVIGLHEDVQGKLSILDGQHRVGMFSILAEKNKDTDGVLDRILVEVFPQQKHHDDSHARDIFLEVNKAEPVKLVDMPGVAKAGDRKILTDAADALREQRPEMFSESQKCRPPHLNVDNLRDALFAANVMARHGVKSSRQLEEWMRQQNELLATKYAQDPQARSIVPAAALEKAVKYNFYLGLESSWYYN